VELDNRLIPVLSKASGEGVLVDLQWPFHALYLRYHFATLVLELIQDVWIFRFRMWSLLTLSTQLQPLLHPASSCVLLFGGPSELLTSGASERILHESLRQIDEFAMHMIQKRMQKLLESSTELRSGLNSDDAPEPLSSPPHMDLLSWFMGVATEAEKLRTLDSSGGDDQKRGGYSDVFLRDIVISFLLAGRDTSSSGKKTFRREKKKPILEKTVRNLILHLFLFSSCRNLLVTK
jgi:hypothetical protein